MFSFSIIGGSEAAIFLQRFFTPLTFSFSFVMYQHKVVHYNDDGRKIIIIKKTGMQFLMEQYHSIAMILKNIIWCKTFP